MENAEGFFEEETGELKRRDLHSMTVRSLSPTLTFEG
jgi:hypothetical protein